MARFTYTGPSYNPSVGIAIEGTENLGNWNGITTDSLDGDAIFLRLMLNHYLFPLIMSDAEVLDFLTNNSQYTAWWTDAGSGNGNGNGGGGFHTHGRYPSREDAAIQVADGLFFTISNTNSVYHGVVMEMIDGNANGNYPSKGRYESVEAAVLDGLKDGDFFTLDNPQSEIHMALIEIILG
jgi:hypothetical protein